MQGHLQARRLLPALLQASEYRREDAALDGAQTGSGPMVQGDQQRRGDEMMSNDEKAAAQRAAGKGNGWSSLPAGPQKQGSPFHSHVPPKKRAEIADRPVTSSTPGKPPSGKDSGSAGTAKKVQ